MTGKVLWFDEAKGFGFIRIADTLKKKLGIAREKDVFVYRDAVLNRKPRVLFADEVVTIDEVLITERGARAFGVSVQSSSR